MDFPLIADIIAPEWRSVHSLMGLIIIIFPLYLHDCILYIKSKPMQLIQKIHFDQLQQNKYVYLS